MIFCCCCFAISDGIKQACLSDDNRKKVSTIGAIVTGVVFFVVGLVLLLVSTLAPIQSGKSNTLLGLGLTLLTGAIIDIIVVVVLIVLFFSKFCSKCCKNCH